MTTGIVLVAFFTARISGVPLTSIRLTLRRINSETSSGKRSLRPPVDRYSITKFSPSMYPYSRNVLRKTFMLGVLILSSRVALSSTPIHQLLSGCWALLTKRQRLRSAQRNDELATPHGAHQKVKDHGLSIAGSEC